MMRVRRGKIDIEGIVIKIASVHALRGAPIQMATSTENTVKRKAAFNP